MHEWVADTAGRLDIFIASNHPHISRMQSGAAIRAGSVLVNGRVMRKPAHILQPGDSVQMSQEGEPVSETRLEVMDLHLTVLYEDDACMVINKPAGIPVHPGAGIPKDAPTILHGVVHLFQERSIPFSSASVLVHRLDKDTTGALLIAKTPTAHKELQKQFEDRTVSKQYLAVVAGVPNPPAAMIEAAIGRSTANRTKMTVLGAGKSRAAKTTYHTLSHSDVAALLACDLHTGRTHQIRVHLQTIGHPILGDPTYLTSKSEDLTARYAITSLCLHAWTLTFRSPADDTEREVRAAPPSTFVKVCERLSLEIPSHA